MQSLEWLRYNADQYWYQDELRKTNYEEEQAAIVEKAAKAEAWRVAHEAEKAAKLQAYLKKETPEEYKARKESQAQRTVKKETPEEYAARTEYMKKKEQLELEAETQRLFNKGEKKHQDHQDYLDIKNRADRQRAERQAKREETEAYNNTEEGREHQARKNIDKAERDKDKAYHAEKYRIWNTDEARRERRAEAIENNNILYQKSIQPGRRSSGGLGGILRAIGRGGGCGKSLSTSGLNMLLSNVEGN